MGAIFNRSSENPCSVSIVARRNFIKAGKVQLSASPVAFKELVFPLQFFLFLLLISLDLLDFSYYPFFWLWELLQCSNRTLPEK